MKVYIAAADAKTVVMGYITPDNVKAALKGGAGGPTGDAELEKTMALMPSGENDRLLEPQERNRHGHGQRARH